MNQDDVKQGGTCCSSFTNGSSRVTQLRMRMKLVTGKNHAIDSSCLDEMSKQGEGLFFFFSLFFECHVSFLFFLI